MVEGDIRLTEEWLQAKNLIKEHLLALSEALAGRINEYAPDGQQLKGSFVGGYLSDDGVSLDVMVGSPLEYGAYVEFGTKPHWAPIEPLKLWVDLHQLDRIEVFIKKGTTTRPSRKISKGKTTSPRERAINSIAYAIQAAIAKRGTRPQRFMERALMDLKLPFTITYDSMGATYEIDIAAYLQERIDTILKQSGMMN